MSKDIVANKVGVTLKGVSKKYGKQQAVSNLSLEIEPGEMVSLLGASGCGKTTTLRMIAGLEHPDSGLIEIGGQPVNQISTWKRNIGMVFQNYALFPHMTVFDNVAFGLQMQKTPSSEIKDRVHAALSLVRMQDYGERMPSQLSGGQRQRIALVRALVTQPKILLLDEPLGALDKKLRDQMQIEIRLLQQRIGITTIFVTHDQEEALTLSDRIVVMDGGRIVQVDTPENIYEKPRTRFVSGFIGLANSLPGTVMESEEGWVSVSITNGPTFRAPTTRAWSPNQSCSVSMRPEKLIAVGADAVAPEGWPVLDAKIAHTVYIGASTYFHAQLETSDEVLVVMFKNDGSIRHDVAGGSQSKIKLSWNPEHSLVFPEDDSYK